MKNLGQLLFEAARQSAGRGDMPTTLGTAELRDLIAADVRSRAVFSARAGNAIFVSKIKEVVTEVAEGEMNEATARWLLLETLRATGYTPEGGFPDVPVGQVPPALKGTLQDLSSQRRLDLIITTQLDLMRGAGVKATGSTPTSLRLYPAWELIREAGRAEPRHWGGKHKGSAPRGRAAGADRRSRWEISGGKVYEGGRLIALKGDPIWGELGSSGNFDDALDVDYPPFAFSSGMGWDNISWSECRRLGVMGPDGETIEEWQAEERAVLGGMQPPVVPEVQVSMAGLDPVIRTVFEVETGAVLVGDVATTAAGAAELRRVIEARRIGREARREERLRRALAR